MIASKDDADKAIAGSTTAGVAALQSTTADSTAAVVELAGTAVADPEKMVTACRAAGVDMPDAPSS